MYPLYVVNIHLDFSLKGLWKQIIKIKHCYKISIINHLGGYFFCSFVIMNKEASKSVCGSGSTQKSPDSVWPSWIKVKTDFSIFFVAGKLLLVYTANCMEVSGSLFKKERRKRLRRACQMLAFYSCKNTFFLWRFRKILLKMFLYQVDPKTVILCWGKQTFKFVLNLIICSKIC